MRSLRLLVLAGSLSGCFAAFDDDPPELPPDPVDSTCDRRGDKLVLVGGLVVDFVTGAPVAGATIEVATEWDGTDECAPAATLVTRGDGSFGPVEVELGSWLNPSFAAFRVSGGGRALTVSDNRTCPEERCTLEHVIPAPSIALADAWRAELAAGGMPDAEARGLVAFRYEEPDGSTAAGVEAGRGSDDALVPLAPGTEVRFLAEDRAALLPATAGATSGAGIALVGFGDGAVFVGGERGGERWDTTGCLVDDGAIFLETRRR